MKTQRWIMILSACSTLCCAHAGTAASHELIVRFDAPPTQAFLHRIAEGIPAVVTWRELSHAPHPRNDPTGIHPLAYVRVMSVAETADVDLDVVASRLALLPGIQHAHENGRLTAPTILPDAEPTVQARSSRHSFPNDPFYPAQWALPMISAPEAWKVTTGSRDVVLAIIDSGFDLTHEDLDGIFWTNPGEIPENGLDDDGNGYVDDVSGWDFWLQDNDPSPSPATGHHGTWVTGIASATLDNGIGVSGMASVSVLPLRFDSEISQIVEALHYATDIGAHLINLSARTGTDFPELRLACEYVWDNGVSFVAGTGNHSGYIEATFPAAYPSVISVSATNQDDEIADLSNYGPHVDVAAPGVGILSTGFTPRAPYRVSNGTSASAPFTAGSLALLYSLQPHLTPERARGFLRAGADDLGEPGRDIYFGFGRVNAAHAVEAVACSLRCPADLSADGTVNVADLIRLFASWGDASWEGDINNDRTTDVEDLLILLPTWGACP